MVARMTFAQIRPEKVDEAVRIFRDSVVPACRTQPGVRGAELFVDPETGRAIAVVFYSSEQSAQEVERSGFVQEQLARFSPLLAAPPQRELFQVAVADAPRIPIPVPV